MLRTNSKQVKENIRKYIMEYSDFENYVGYAGYEKFELEPQNFQTTARQILIIFNSEKFYNKSDFKTFLDWCQGLPSALDTCFFYNRSAVDDLAKILKETDEEKSKFSEQQAGELLTKLIYRELVSVED